MDTERLIAIFTAPIIAGLWVAWQRRRAKKEADREADYHAHVSLDSLPLLGDDRSRELSGSDTSAGSKTGQGS